MKLGSPRIGVLVAAAALAGGGAGAGAYALFNSDGGTTVVRRVQVTQSLQAAAKSGSTLSVGSIYKHAYLGVALKSATEGVRLDGICTGTPAVKAGLQVGDVITSFAGKKVTSVDALRFAVDAKHPDDRVTVTFLRGGKSRTATVTLGTRPATTC